MCLLFVVICQEIVIKRASESLRIKSFLAAWGRGTLWQNDLTSLPRNVILGNDAKVDPYAGLTFDGEGDYATVVGLDDVMRRGSFSLSFWFTKTQCTVRGFHDKKQYMSYTSDYIVQRSHASPLQVPGFYEYLYQHKKAADPGLPWTDWQQNLDSGACLCDGKQYFAKKNLPDWDDGPIATAPGLLACAGVRRSVAAVALRRQEGGASSHAALHRRPDLRARDFKRVRGVGARRQHRRGQLHEAAVLRRPAGRGDGQPQRATGGADDRLRRHRGPGDRRAEQDDGCATACHA